MGWEMYMRDRGEPSDLKIVVRCYQHSPFFFFFYFYVFFFKQKTAYEIGVRLVGSEMCIRDRQMTAVNENFDLVIGNTPFQLNENAHRQLGLQLKIPAPYYERMRAENPGLLMANVNGWFQQSPDTRRMVRTLDGTARAILSDRYRRIDNYEVAQTVLPIISEMQGARIESCELTDTRMYIKVVNERIQTEVVPGDIVQAGILISNSEVGMGSVSVKPLIYRLVCTNGMVADVGVGKRHVGRINESVDGDFGIFRDETIEADDRAFLMKIEDTVRAAVDEARFNALVQKLRDAKEAPILPAAAPKVVELAAKEFNIRQNESEGILGHLIAGGDLSLYGLANAVTRHAQDVQSYDRSTELEATGYKIITMQPSLLKRWNEEVSTCLLYTSPSPRDGLLSRMPSSA